MINRALTVACCPSGSCIGASTDADRDATADAKGESHTRDLLRAVDFYATVLAMASHDLRQPLQGSLARTSCSPGASPLDPSGSTSNAVSKQAINWRKSSTSWSKRCSCNSAQAGSNRYLFSSILFWSVLRYSSMDLHSAKGSTFVPSEHAR